jgi:hypothetical protein
MTSIQILVASEVDAEKASRALEILGNLITNHGEKIQMDLTEDDRNLASSFILSNRVSIGTAQLDTALMGEIGKAYKEQYVTAKASGDIVVENKMLGAMFAIKRIMEMVNEPQY